MSASSGDKPEKVLSRVVERNRDGALQVPNSEDSEVSDVAEVVEDNQNLTSGLPFSKARCFALVATLSGAAFLNVSQLSLSLSVHNQGLT